MIIFYLLGNATIGNDYFGTEKQNKKQKAAGQITRQATGKRPSAPNGQSAPGQPLTCMLLIISEYAYKQPFN